MQVEIRQMLSEYDTIVNFWRTMVSHALHLDWAAAVSHIQVRA